MYFLSNIAPRPVSDSAIYNPIAYFYYPRIFIRRVSGYLLWGAYSRYDIKVARVVCSDLFQAEAAYTAREVRDIDKITFRSDL